MKNYKVFGVNPIVPFENPIAIEKPLRMIKDILLEEKIGYQVQAMSPVISILNTLYIQGKQHPGNTTRVEKIIMKARNKIENLSPTSTLNVKTLAEDLGMSYSWFRKMYKHYTGCSPVQYRIILNIGRASELLMGSHLCIKEIAYKTGFESEAYFCRQFKQKQGMSPTEFRTRG